MKTTNYGNKWPFNRPPPKIEPLQVVVQNERDFEDAFRKFKSLVQKEKVITDYKERQFYEKPSLKRRRKKREAYARKLALEFKQKQMQNGEWEKKMKKKLEKKNSKSKKPVKTTED